ncbi:MAG: hypothetical protein ACYC7E_00690 [Armatimonadota bacterium]
MRNILVFGLAAMLASATFAYPSFLGATGTGLQPDAAVANGTELALDYYNTSGSIGAPDATYPIRVAFGNGQSFEFYANYFYLQDFESWGVGGKYSFPLSETGLKLAVGANFGNGIEGADVDILQAYLVGDFPLGENAKATLGVQWTRLEASGNTDGFRYSLGLNAALTPRVNFVADYQTSLWGFNEVYSAAIRYAFTPMISGQLGYTNSLWNIGGSTDADFFVGVNFGFGGVAEE